MQKIALSLFVTLLFASLIACGGRKDQPSDIEIQATVQAALAATQTAQANFDNAVNNAVHATAQANTPASAPQTIIVTATPQAGPTIIYIQTTPLPPTATPVNTLTLTEQELVALIDQAVAEAYAAANAAYTTTTASTQDGQVTTTETQSMTYYVQVSAQQVDEALALIEQYYALYSEMSAQTLATLQAIENDLNAIAENTASMAQALEEINQALQQGVAMAEDTLAQLNAAAQNAQRQAQAAQAQAQTWSQNVKNEINTRGQRAANVQPNAIANNPQEALGQLQTYIETARGILEKGALTPQDLQQLAQQSANAKAALQKFGGANAAPLIQGIDSTTLHIARGELPQAKSSFSGLEKNVGAFSFSGSPAGGVNPGGGVKPGSNVNPGGGGGGGGIPKPRP
jgi:hypothetical protein